MKDYVKEAKRQPSNKEHFKMLDSDPTETHKKLVDQTIDRFKKDKTLKEKIAEGLKTVNPRTPKFYTTPKIHKVGNPGKPLVSSIKSPTQKISEFVGFHLQPIVTEISSYVRDTKDFLNKITTINNVSEETYLVTMGVKYFTPTLLTQKEL